MYKNKEFQRKTLAFSIFTLCASSAIFVSQESHAFGSARGENNFTDYIMLGVAEPHSGSTGGGEQTPPDGGGGAPEPATIFLLASGAAAIGVKAARRRSSR